jgi:hypothetical protein
MQAVEAFVERTRKEADDSIKALTREADTLRGRLLKVEAALERWKAVAQSLKREPGPVVLEPAPHGVESTRVPGPAPIEGEQKK